jgi:hypothetical protein
MPLVTESQMAALEDLVITGMTTPIAVLSLQTIEVEDGDDFRGWVQTADTDGWIWEPPDYPAGGVVGRVIGNAHEFRLYLRRRIDVQIGDRIGADGVVYEVLNTNDANTYQPMLRVALRRVD